MQTIINILVFLLIMTAIVVIHEFGHFITAKFFGVYCGAFSIGMGPKIFSHKRENGETEFQIRALPIGGFVTMAGEADQEETDEFKDVPLERSLKGKKTYQKVIIFLAGVFNNFILGLVILFALNMTVGTMPVANAKIGSIIKDSPAEVAGIQKDDVITKMVNVDTNETYTVATFDDMTSALTLKDTSKASIHMKVTIVRDGQTQVVDVYPTYNSETQRYQIGVRQATRKMTFSESISHTWSLFVTMATTILTALSALATHFSSTVKQMSGPVGIYSVTSEVTESGDMANLLYLMALLSINIGVFNLLPIPGLDGAQTLFAIIEGIIHRELPIKVKYALQLAGLALVLGLMFFITIQDILKLAG